MTYKNESLSALLRNLTRERHFLDVRNPDCFPFSALPQLLQHSAWEIQQETQAPLPSIVGALLVGAATALQGLVEVEKRPRLVSPVSLYILCALPPGERKSATLDLAWAGIRAFDRAEDNRSQARLAQRRCADEAGEATIAGIRRRITHLTANGEPTELEVAQLARLLDERSKTDRHLKPVLEKITAAALKHHLTTNAPVVACLSDEAMAIVSGKLLDDFSMINKLFDGGDIKVNNAAAEFVVRDPRMTLGLWGQPALMKKYIGKNDNLRASGFLARCFVIQPILTSGSRCITGFGEPKPTPALDAFNAFCQQQLEDLSAQLPATEVNRKRMRFAQDAQKAWLAELNELENKTASTPPMSDFRGLASKHADKIARLAALFQCLDPDGDEDFISGYAMACAITVGRWLFEHTAAIISPPLIFQQEFQHAVILQNWFTERHVRYRETAWRRTDVMHIGPGAVRKKRELDAALDVLYRQNFLALSIDPRNRTQWIVLNTTAPTCQSQSYAPPMLVTAI